MMRLFPTLNGPGGPARRIAAVIAAIALLMAGGAVCTWIYTTVTAPGGAEQHDGHDEHGGGADLTDARQVAAGVLTTLYSWSPAVDRSPDDAATRALPQLTGTARAEIERKSGPVRPIAQWPQWAADKAIVTATVPTDTMTTVPIQAGPTSTTLRAQVTQTIQPQAGPPTPYAQFTVRVTLTRADPHERGENIWRVAELTFTDLG